jgi:hypothetical protein
MSKYCATAKPKEQSCVITAGTIFWGFPTNHGHDFGVAIIPSLVLFSIFLFIFTFLFLKVRLVYFEKKGFGLLVN